MPPALDSYVVGRCTEPRNCPWLTEGDVIADCCTKCGTNWLMTIVHELQTWNEPNLRDFNDILEIPPWLELIQYPGILNTTK